MKHVLHQLKKDLVHQRWALAGWVTLLLVHLLVSGFQILRHVPNPQPSTEQFAGLVAGWVVFAPLLFVILAVQSDTPMGTSAFWLTRPLRGPQMLAAKALFVILLFLILPLAVEMTILLLRGAGANTWLLLPEFSVVRLPVVLAAFALGAATQRFLHALTLAATGMALSFATLLLGYYIFLGGPDSSTPPPFSGSRGIVALWALAATFAAVVVVQFLTRREGFSRCLFAVGIGGAIILQLVWPWDILGRSPEQESGYPGQIDLHIEPTSIKFGSAQESLSRGAPMPFIAIPMAVVGGRLSAGEFLAPVASRVELVTASSSDLTEPSGDFVKPSDRGYRVALESQLAPDLIKLAPLAGNRGAGDGFNMWSHSFKMADGQFDQRQRDLEEIRVTVDIGVFGFERAGELPLRDGVTWRDHGDQLEIVQVQWATQQTLRIKIREQVLSLMFAARNTYGRQNGHPLVLLLANRDTKTAIVLRPEQSSPMYRGASWISPFLRTEEMIDVNLREALGVDFTPEAAEAWREASTLVIVRKNNLGSFRVNRTVKAAAIRQNP